MEKEIWILRRESSASGCRFCLCWQVCLPQHHRWRRRTGPSHRHHIFALALGFLLPRIRKIMVKRSHERAAEPHPRHPVIMAYLMAGILAQLLRQSGLYRRADAGITRVWA